jgi:hypothetical protein
MDVCEGGDGRRERDGVWGREEGGGGVQCENLAARVGGAACMLHLRPALCGVEFRCAIYEDMR